MQIKSTTYPQYGEFFAEVMKMAEKNIEISAVKDWKTQMSCMPGSGMIWQWDSCFMALYSDFSGGILNGLNNLDNLYSCQRDDGYISMTYVTATRKEAFGERINPPLYAYVEYQHYLRTGDASRFERIYPVLKKYFNWIENNRKRANGLYYFEDTGSSGMDNSPRSGYPARDLLGSDVCFVDLACQQNLSAQYLAKIASLLGFDEDAQFFEQKSAEIAALVNKIHWHEKSGFYYDVFVNTNNYLNCKTVAAFWPLLCGICNEEQTEKLLKHLLNPAEFNTPHPFATLSADDINYSPSGKYWCGSVWSPANYMILKGLQKINRSDLARKFAMRHLDCQIEVFNSKEFPSLWECYSPEFMRPADNKEGKTVRPDFAGWSALGATAHLVEEIAGVEFNAPQNLVRWHLNTSESWEITDMLFNSELLSLKYENGEVQLDYAGKLDLQVISDGKIYELKKDRETVSAVLEIQK